VAALGLFHLLVWRGARDDAVALIPTRARGLPSSEAIALSPASRANFPVVSL
jgi:hypothetical protein